MYCKNCGQQINDNADVCLNCGVQVKKADDNPSHFAGIAACCFPIVGLILYFIWREEKPNSAKLICYWMIGGVVAWIALYAVAIVLGLIGSVGY